MTQPKTEFQKSLDTTEVGKNLTKNNILDSALVAFYTHAKCQNPSPSAVEIMKYLEEGKALKNKILRDAFHDMQREVSQVYHMDDKEIQKRIFPNVEKRRLAGFNAVLNQKPEVVIDLGCGSLIFLLDLLKTNTNILGVGLDFRENLIIADQIIEEVYPQFLKQINLQSIDLTNSNVLKAVFSFFIEHLQNQNKAGNLVIYNQGLFRYIPKSEQKILAKSIYEIFKSYPSNTTWVQTDNEILLSSADVSNLNGTQANIFLNQKDMFETFESAGWKIDHLYFQRHGILLLTI